MLIEICLLTTLFLWLSQKMPALLLMPSSFHHPPFGSRQPPMSSHSPPLAPSFDLSVCLADLFLLSLSSGRHLARLSRSIPGTALQENPVSCYSQTLSLQPVPLHQSNSCSLTRQRYCMCKNSEKNQCGSEANFKTKMVSFISGITLIKNSYKICSNQLCTQKSQAVTASQTSFMCVPRG